VTDLRALSERLTDIAVAAADAAADGIRAGFRSTMDVAYKRDHHDPVTEHDRRAEERIREVLLRAVPDSSIVGEEGGTSTGAGRVRWHVDPIDGTANFAAGSAYFCTSIGAEIDGEPVAGVVLDPMAGNLFTAHLGGAFRNGRRLRCTGRSAERHGYLVTSYPSVRDLDDQGPDALRRFESLVRGYGTVRRHGAAALSLAHVAAGWAEAGFGTGVHSWDVCAGALLVRQAGGVYRSFTPGDPTGTDWTAPGYLAHVPELAADLVTATVDELVGGGRG
jgi:myo-inositol-1(or 4)-monophosphatase